MGGVASATLRLAPFVVFLAAGPRGALGDVGNVDAGPAYNSSSTETPSASSTQSATGPVALSLSVRGNIVVAWTSPFPLAFPPQVRYWPSPSWGAFGGDAEALAITAPATIESQWRNLAWSYAELPGLDEGTPYTYQVSGEAGAHWGPRRELIVPEGANPSGWSPRASATSFHLALVGDLGVDDVGEQIVEKLAQGGVDGISQYDAFAHLGDIAGNLTDDGGGRGDDFLQMITPFASSRPYMTLPGDRDELVAYNHFFRMPHEVATDPWYSFSAAGVRFLMLWTEALDVNSEQGSRQLYWLENTLELYTRDEERRRYPWIIAMGHRPLYCTMSPSVCSVEALQLRSTLEPLFRRFGVDMYLSAHLHAYERTFPVDLGSRCSDRQDGVHRVEQPCAPIYIVNGDAGEPSLRYHMLPASWTAQRHPGSPGFGVLSIMNETHLRYRQLDVSETVVDELWVLKTIPGTLLIPGEEEEEPFLEAVGWLAFTTAVVTGTCAFIRWVHGDGRKRRDEALRIMRSELAVLAGLPIRDLELDRLVSSNSDRGGGMGLH